MYEMLIIIYWYSSDRDVFLQKLNFYKIKLHIIFFIYICKLTQRGILKAI